MIILLRLRSWGASSIITSNRHHSTFVLQRRGSLSFGTNTTPQHLILSSVAAFGQFPNWIKLELTLVDHAAIIGDHHYHYHHHASVSLSTTTITATTYEDTGGRV